MVTVTKSLLSRTILKQVLHVVQGWYKSFVFCRLLHVATLFFFFFSNINPWCDACLISTWKISISCHCYVSSPFSNSDLHQYVIDTDIWSNLGIVFLRPGLSDYIDSLLLVNTISLLLSFGIKFSLIYITISLLLLSPVSQNCCYSLEDKASLTSFTRYLPFWIMF